MASSSHRGPGNDERICRLLDRYNCPMPFHRVRTRMLGSIAAPGPTVSPMEVMAGVWGDQIPTFESIATVNELLYALVMSLWNRLARHQSQSAPFRLTRAELNLSRAELHALAARRCQELDGFVEGMFAGRAVIELPWQAHSALVTLAQIQARFSAVVDAGSDASDPLFQRDPRAVRLDMQTATRRAERQIHSAVTSCALARHQALASIPVTRAILR